MPPRRPFLASYRIEHIMKNEMQAVQIGQYTLCSSQDTI